MFYVYFMTVCWSTSLLVSDPINIYEHLMTICGILGTRLLIFLSWTQVQETISNKFRLYLPSFRANEVMVEIINSALKMLLNKYLVVIYFKGCPKCSCINTYFFNHLFYFYHCVASASPSLCQCSQMFSAEWLKVRTLLCRVQQKDPGITNQNTFTITVPLPVQGQCL